MRALLITLTVVEIVVFLGAVVVYLVAIARSLLRTAGNLGKVSFGVRAIETQTAPIGPSVTRINAQLATISAALGGVADLAEQRAQGRG
jgi:ABC-type branched-subunit amino acid transport system permease subunit